MKIRNALPLLVAALTALSPRLFCQEPVEIFGYFESQGTAAVIQGEGIQLFSNKLRLDLKSRPSELITFAANFNAITYHGKTRWNILDYLPDDLTGAVPEALRPYYVLPFENRYYLDNAYLKLTLGAFDLTAGKQQVSPGTGYAWNPTDLFNTKDLLDPTYEQPGHNALRLDIELGEGRAMSVIYSPGADWNTSGKMVELKGRLGHFDLALVGVEKRWRYHDYTRFDPERMDFMMTPEKRRMLGAAAAGELLGLGVWAEFGHNWMARSDDFSELAAGLDYTFDFQTYIMLEVFHSSLGRSRASDYTLNDWMRLLAAEQKTFTRNQAYLFLRHPLTDLLQAGVSLISSLSDGSAALVPTLQYSFSDSVEIMAYINLYLGKEGTVYAGNLGNGGLIRARIYF